MPENADEPSFSAHRFMVESGVLRGIVIDGFRTAMKNTLEAQHFDVAAIMCDRFPIVCLRLRLPQWVSLERLLRLRLKVHSLFRLAGYPVAAHDLRLCFSQSYMVLVYAKPRWTLYENTLKEIVEGRVCPA